MSLSQFPDKSASLEVNPTPTDFNRKSNFFDRAKRASRISFKRVNLFRRDSTSSIKTIEYNLDEVFSKFVGGFGLFQKLLFLYIVLLIGPLMAFNTITQFLILIVPPHECFDKHNRNFSYHNDVVRTHIAAQHNMTTIFNLTIFYPTVVSENNWACQDEAKALLPHTIYKAGGLSGILIIGILSDRFGRVPVIIGCFLIAGFAGFGTILSAHNYPWFLLNRFLMGFVTMKGSIAMVLVTEHFGKNERSYVSNGLLFTIALTSALLPWIALLLRDWRALTVFTSAAMFIPPFITMMIPESVRWLMSRGDSSKANSILTKVAKVNDKKFALGNKARIGYQKSAKLPLSMIIKYRTFMINFALTSTIWFGVQIVSFGGNLYAANRSDNPFSKLSLNAILDILATFSSQFLANQFGRKITVIVGGISTSLAYVSTIFLNEEQWLSMFILIALGRFFVTLCYNVKYLYGCEIFPTVIRVRALSLRMTIGSLGLLITPYLLTYRQFGHNTPLLIFGIISLVTTLPMAFLPETRSRPLPETMEEANDFNQLKETLTGREKRINKKLATTYDQSINYQLNSVSETI